MEKRLRKQTGFTHLITAYIFHCNAFISLAVYTSIAMHFLYWGLAIASVIADYLVCRHFMQSQKALIGKAEGLLYWLIVAVLTVLDILFVFLLFRLSSDQAALSFVRIMETALLGLYLFERFLLFIKYVTFR